MINIRVSELLREYHAVHGKVDTMEKKILVQKYNNLFQEVKYKFEQMFRLGEDNYEIEFDLLLTEIAQREIVIIAILEELIEVSS
jgi:hypothetical protein